MTWLECGTSRKQTRHDEVLGIRWSQHHLILTIRFWLLARRHPCIPHTGWWVPQYTMTKQQSCRDMQSMETLSALLALCEGNHRYPMDSPHNGLETQSFDIFFVVSLNKLLNKQSSFRGLATPWRLCDISVLWQWRLGIQQYWQTSILVPKHFAINHDIYDSLQYFKTTQNNILGYLVILNDLHAFIAPGVQMCQ